ncbi:MAG: hypothetical protein U0325_20970 [Polyangiales bacterium]
MRSSLALVLGWGMACGARSELSPPGDAGAPTAPIDRPTEVVDVPQDVGRPCGCPGTPGFQRCFLPRMCCPVTRTCEDPARFNCTGPTPPACP